MDCKHKVMQCRNCEESFFTEEAQKTDKSRQIELKIALSEALKWMGKGIADNVYKNCVGDAEKYFSYLNDILNKD